MIAQGQQGQMGGFLGLTKRFSVSGEFLGLVELSDLAPVTLSHDHC